MGRYPSKRDAWLVCVLVPAFVLPVTIGVRFLLCGDLVGIGVLVLAAQIAALNLWLLLGTHYTIDASGADGQLHVRCAFYRRSIPLAAIRQVRPTRNPLSSPALSLDRLEISFQDEGAQTILISPARREAFLSELRAACPDATIG